MFGKFLKLLVAVLEASHRTSVCLGQYCITPRVYSQCSLSPSWICRWHDFCTGLMAWIECHSHLVSYGIMFFTFQQYAAVLFSRLYSLLATVGLACICVFCSSALLPVSQREFHLVSHKKICHACLAHAAPLAGSCLQHLFSGRLK